MKNNYQILENKHNGVQAVKLFDPPFDGIIYTYGRITMNVDEENDTLHLGFEYEVVDWAGKMVSDNKPFEAYIGKILEEMIHQGIEENSLVYTGGIDENRAEDSSESDS